MNLKINTYTYEPNREECSKEFMLPKHDTFRTWYFKNHTKEQLIKFKDEYYNYLKLIDYEISFVEWYNLKKFKINVSKKTRRWDTIYGNVITSKHPPVVILNMVI